MNKERPVFNRILITLLIIAVIAAAVFVFDRNFRRENTEIVRVGTFSHDVTEDQIFSGLFDKYTVLFYLRVRAEEFFGRTREIPYAEKMDVELVDRNTCNVYVYGKAVIGCIEVMQQYMYFDREGIVTDCAREKLPNIPLIRGVDFTSVVIGEKLPDKVYDLIDTIQEITMLLTKNELNAEDITFGNRYEVTLHIGDDEILLGKGGDFDVKINNLPYILASAGEGAFIFDMRSYSETSRSVTAKPVTY